MAPGRSVIESMACGKPTIAVGSKKYIGLIKHDNWKQGVYNNFGGYGSKFNDYEVGSLEREMDILIENKRNIALLGKFSHEIALSHFNSTKINQNLLNLYNMILIENSVENLFNSFATS